MKRSLHVLLLALFLAGWSSAQVTAGRFIVELNAEPAVVGLRAKSDPASAKKAAAVLQQQSAVSAEAQSLGVEVVGAAQAVANALVVEGNDFEIRHLSALPGVKRIVPVRQYRALLDGVVEVHQFPRVWAGMGFENAGKGMKIAILDTGIDVTHPGLQDSTLAAVDGFPKTSRDTNVQYTNHKVIVARNYVGTSAADEHGHGTGVAMIAAGRTHIGSRGRITGIAPFSYLGNYRVLGRNGLGGDDGILLAIDDALKDGMDVINMSLGSFPAPALSEDILVDAIERATRAGVVVVVAAGNSGPGWNTIDAPAHATSAIAVGNSANGRTFSGAASVNGQVYRATPGSRSDSANTLTGPLLDLAVIDSSALACGVLPAGSLAGKVVLISRGECNFSEKLQFAQQAGAIGALVHSRQDSPDIISMDVGDVTLPAASVSYADGLAIKRDLAAAQDRTLQVTINFTPIPVWSDPNRLADSSSRGPSIEGGIKPDILAVGSPVITASSGGTTDRPRYIEGVGTSLSAPVVAGAAALLKQVRPGLTVDQYRSLLINSAQPFTLTATGQPANVQQGGAGLLYMPSVMQSTLAAAPTSLGYGIGSGTAEVVKTLAVTNLGAASDLVSIVVTPAAGSAAPLVSANTLEISPGATREIAVRLPPVGRGTGVHEGALILRSSLNGTEARVPYWLGIPDSKVAKIEWFEPEPATRGAEHKILFRAIDNNGLAVPGVQAEIVSETDGTTVEQVGTAAGFPGYFGARLNLGPSRRHEFLIRAADAEQRITILVQ